MRRWLSKVGLLKSMSVERSWVRIPPARFRILGKFVTPRCLVSRDASSLSEKVGSRSQTKGGRTHSNVKALPRWLLVSFL